MQIAACLEWERPRRKPASLVALVAWCSIAVIIVSPACVAQDAFPNPLTPSQSLWPPFPKSLVYRFMEPTAVYVVDQKECELKADPKWGWSPDEKWAWKQICGHLPVDFDDRKANECAELAGVDHDKVYQTALATFQNTDPTKRLSGDFLSRIFGEPILRPHTWTEQLRFAGFNTDRLDVDTALLKSLELRHAHVGRLSIHNAAFDGGVTLENVRSRSVKIELVSAKDILLTKVSVSENNSELVPRQDNSECSMSATVGEVRGASGEREKPKQSLSNKEEQDGKLLIDKARINDRLAIVKGDYGAMKFVHLKVDDLFINQPKWTGAKDGKTPDLSITESVDNGVFTLRTDPDSESQSKPNQIELEQFNFAKADLGTDPMPIIKVIDVDTKSPDFEPYTLIAKSYAERGETDISDRVLIAMNERNRDLVRPQSWADYAKRTNLAKTYEFLQLSALYHLVRYGYSPEIGFVYILLFVLLGWAIFWCTSGRLEAGAHQPKTLFATFLLAFDSVIPGIQLDKNNLDVRYKGWPQKMLYLLRALGAVLVAVAYSFLQKRLYG